MCGKTILGSGREEGAEKRRPFSCRACGLRGYRASLSLIRLLAAQTHHLHGDGGRQGEKKTGLLIQRRVIFSLVVELLTDVAWQRRERVREGGISGGHGETEGRR